MQDFQYKLVPPQPIKAQQHIKIIATNAVYPHCRIAPTHAQPPVPVCHGPYIPMNTDGLSYRDHRQTQKMFE
jgi:hypothetical protein